MLFEDRLSDYFFSDILKIQLNEVADFASGISAQQFFNAANEHAHRCGVVFPWRHQIGEADARVVLPPLHASAEPFAGLAPTGKTLHENVFVFMAHAFDIHDFLNFVETDAFESKNERRDFDNFNPFQMYSPKNIFAHTGLCLLYHILHKNSRGGIMVAYINNQEKTADIVARRRNCSWLCT